MEKRYGREQYGMRSRRSSRSRSPRSSRQSSTYATRASSSSVSSAQHTYDHAYQRSVPVSRVRDRPRSSSPSSRRPSQRGPSTPPGIWHALPESSRRLPSRPIAPRMSQPHLVAAPMKRRRTSSSYDPRTHHEREKGEIRTERRDSRSPPSSRRRTALDHGVSSSARGELDAGYARGSRPTFDRPPTTNAATESQRSRSSPPPVERMGTRRKSPSPYYYGRRSNSPGRYEDRQGPGERRTRALGQEDWNHRRKPRSRSRSRGRSRSRDQPTRRRSPPLSQYEGGYRRTEERESGRNSRRFIHERNESQDRDGFSRHQAYTHHEATPSNELEAHSRDEPVLQVHRHDTSDAVGETVARPERRMQGVIKLGSEAFAVAKERGPNEPPAPLSVVVEDEKAATPSRNFDQEGKGTQSSSTTRNIHGNVNSGVVYGGTINMNYNGEPSKLLELLMPSRKADYRYCPHGNESCLSRGFCIKGSRKSILHGIMHWAISPPSDSTSIYWLSGHAGTGKTTIANTVCHELDAIVSDDGGRIVVGGSFFCSRQFPETRDSVWIVRTIVYQLALKSKAFKAALVECGRFETVDHGPRSQLLALLVEPWNRSTAARMAGNQPVCAIFIDALDELEREQGLVFLRTLLDVVKEHRLSGLKFFVTSRLDHDLVQEVESFHDKQVCRLEQVPVEETNADIKLYLDKNLGECATEAQILRLVLDAAGLFIYAATVVEYVKGRDLEDQKNLLWRLITAPPSTGHQPPLGATATLDKLYTQILETSLVDQRDLQDHSAFEDCLSILHTFLCTVERTSTSVAVGVLNGTRDEGSPALHSGNANGILRRLHAILYVKGCQVMWFHQSFPDFMFSKARSQKFFCNQDHHHCRLAQGCFAVMNTKLRFNIANIPSSYQLDRDNGTLAGSIDSNISSVLRYTCGSWMGHLTLTPDEQADDLLAVLHNFLQLKVLFWIEAMNLLGYGGCCQGMLRDAQKWVATTKDPVGWAKELADAAAFAMYHSSSGAAASTPHLYISSLATFPRNSALLQQWRHNFEGIPGFVNATGVQAILSSFVADSSVKAVAVAPDGVTVVIGTILGLQTWDLTTGQIVKTFQGHTKAVNSVAFSPDGIQVVSGSDDRSVRVWDVSSGEEVKMFEGHTRTVCSVAFSPGGTQVASGSGDKAVRVWDLTSGQEVKIFEGHTDWVRSVTFSPDGTQIASGSDDRSVRVWDVLNGEEVKIFEGHTDFVLSVAFSPDCTQIVSGSANQSVRVWDTSSLEEVMTFNGHTSWVRSVAFSPDGTLVASGSSDKSVRVWDVSSGEEVKMFEGHTNEVNSVAFSPDGTQVISSSDDQSVRVWEVSVGEEVKTVLGHTGTIFSVAFSPNGTQVASGSADNSVRVWDASSGEEMRAFEGHTGEVNSVAFSPDGTLVVSGADDKSIRVWDLSSGEELKTLKGHTHRVNSVAFSPDGTLVVSGSADQSIQLWDVSSGEEVKTFNGHTNLVRSVAFSPDGTLVVSGSDDQSVRVWDVLSGEWVKSFNSHTGYVHSVAFSHDGTWIVSGSWDKSVRVWDVSSGQEVKTFEGHTDWVRSVAFSPDGTQVASGSNNGSVRLWNISSGEEVKAFNDHTSGVTSVAFSPDGTRVVSGSADKTIRFWHCPGETFQLRYIRQKSQDKNYTGWLLEPDNPSSYLMFVPLPANLPDDSNILTIPSTLVPKLDLSGVKLGDRWTECYTPKSQ